MCFAKSTPAVAVKPQDPVIQHEANASITKNSQNSKIKTGFAQNVKTTALGLEDSPQTQKKTLLGE